MKKDSKRFISFMASLLLAVLLPVCSMPVSASADQSGIGMHRLYNPNSGEHFYTGDVKERDDLAEAGWSYEGVAWHAPEGSGIPVYRLYDPNAGDHHYTKKSEERDGLISEGWKDEGIGWYAAEAENLPVFRLYNPNAPGAGSHHYTADLKERDFLLGIGWRDEGIGWYALNEKKPSSTDLVVLSTTDMHGKCWETNLLTGEQVTENMLRVSTAVQEIRGEYGEENVILLDNGDIFQGAPISEVHLLDRDHPEDEPEAMALCLEEIGYDALVLGNHEFNYPWEIMHRAYDDLERNGVKVLAANAYYDGSDGIHEAGENAFGTYMIHEITVNGKVRRIGLLGLENNDITRWDMPVNYPGIIFAAPDNPAYDQAIEASRYIKEMQEDGCELIIVSYHGGLGSGGKPRFGVDSESQGLHIIEETDAIDLMVTGHDHYTGYTNTFATDHAGRNVLIVNGGGRDLTKTVFRLTENEDGELVSEIISSDNLLLKDYEPDQALQEKIRPYAESTGEKLDESIGTLTGDWDNSKEFYLAQSDAMDLISAAMMEMGTAGMKEKYGSLLPDMVDHIEVDAVLGSAANGGYIPQSGDISMRDIYRLCKYPNECLILPMQGREILSVLNENADERLYCRVIGEKPYFFSRNDQHTHIIAGGINFTYDMAKPKGERVTIDGFSNGSRFDPDRTYLIAVNNYILGNERCGLRSFSSDDAVWDQRNDDQGRVIQDIIKGYIEMKTVTGGGVDPAAFNWKWSVTYTGDPAAVPPYEGKIYAKRMETPKDGQTCLIYHEPQGCAMTDIPKGSGYGITGIEAYADALIGPIPENTALFTVHVVEEKDQDGYKRIMLEDKNGHYLTCREDGGLTFKDAPADNDLSIWQLIPIDGGYHVRAVGSDKRQALEYYNNSIMTYYLGRSNIYLFNFYEVI